MSRNVTIVITILILVVLAGYLVWIRSRLAPVSPQVQVEQLTPIPTVEVTPSPVASLSATPKLSITKTQKIASPSAKPK